MSRPIKGTTRLLVTANHDGVRLDVFLAAAAGISRRAARRLIADGRVRRNGEQLRVQSRSVIGGDVVDVEPSASGPELTESPPVTIEILFEDPWLLVAAKPPGVLSQPAEGRAPEDDPAFDQQVLLALAWRSGRRPFLRMVHRLDRTTSGAVLFARLPEALPELSRAWAEGRVERRYWAIVEGRPAAQRFTVDRPIARDPDHRWRFRCADGGKPCRTEIEVLAELEDDLSLVGCRLITGRTHQVRVHLANAGHPVLGDRLYGSRRAGMADRPLLHAVALGLPHPATGEPLIVVCPPPSDLGRYIPDDLRVDEV